MDKKVLNEIEASRYIGMSLSFLRQDRCYGAIREHTPGPVFLKIGKAVRYHINDLDNWLQRHRKSRNTQEKAM